jgi:hypothetical protein
VKNNYIFIIACIYSAIFYRLGGMGGTWYKRSKIRDLVCPLVVLAVMEWTHRWHWSLLICYPLMVVMISTYWKVINKVLKQPQDDCYWFNWFFHGLCVGLALLPYGYMTHTVDLVLVRAYLVGFSMMFWSLLIEDVYVEEGGRGALLIALASIL